MNASGIVNERSEESIAFTVSSTADERSCPVTDVAWWWCSDVADGVVGPVREVEWCHRRKRDLFTQAGVSIAAFDELPDERGRKSAIEGGKKLRKQLLRKEAGAPASIVLQPRRTNLVDEGRALAPPLGPATAGCLQNLMNTYTQNQCANVWWLC